MQDAIAAFVHDSLDPMVEWLDVEIARTRYDGEFAKLAASGRSEQHLVLRLHATGMPAEHWIPMADAIELPTRPPAPSGRHLTGLWLLPPLDVVAVAWTSEHEWFKVRPDEFPGLH